MTDLSRAWQLYELDRWEDAIQETEDALRSDPENVEAMSLLAVCDVNVGRTAKATKGALQAVKFDPQEPLAWWALTAVHAMNGEAKAARAAAHRWLELKPQNPEALRMLAWTYFAENEHKRSLEFLDRALEINPELASAKAMKAQVLTILGRSSEALAMAHEGLSESPDDSDAHTTQAWVHLEAGRVREAVLAYREALRINPRNQTAVEGLKEALRRHIPPYRWMMKVLMLGARVPDRYSWVFGAVILVLVGIIRSIGFNLMPFVAMTAMLLLLLGMMYLAPLFLNITLLAHPLGRLALSKVERAEAVSLAVVLAAQVAGILLLPLKPNGLVVVVPLFAVGVLGLSAHVSDAPRGRTFIAWVTATVCILAVMFFAFTARGGGQ